MQELLTQFRGARDTERRALIRRVNPQALVEDAVGKGRSGTIMGKDENGFPFRTLPPQKLGITVTGCGVATFRQGRDDLETLRELPREEADRLVRRKVQQRDEVEYMVDLYRAVRLFQHIRDGYRAEFLATALMDEADALNARLASTNPSGLNSEAAELAKSVQSLEASLRLMKSGPKILASQRFQEAKAHLEAAKESSRAFEVQTHLGAACALLVAMRNRLGKLRDEDILRRGSSAYLRECALRPQRDQDMRGALMFWSNILQNPGRAFAFQRIWLNDMDTIGLLLAVKRSTLQQVLDTVRDRDMRLDSFCSQMTRAFTSMEAGNYDQAQRNMKVAAYLLGSRNPFYILEQIEKTRDIYLVGGEPNRAFADYLKNAVQAFEGGAMQDARRILQGALQRSF